MKDSSLESEEVAKQAVQGQVTAWISVAALYSQKGQICRAEQCHLLVLRACQASGLKLDAGKCLLEAGKCQLRRGECKRAHALFSAATLLFEGTLLQFLSVIEKIQLFPFSNVPVRMLIF